MIYVAKTLVITLDNGYDVAIKKDGDQFLSAKESRRGLGLSSVKDIVEKYDGTIEIKYDDHNFCVSLSLAHQI